MVNGINKSSVKIVDSKPAFMIDKFLNILEDNRVSVYVPIINFWILNAKYKLIGLTSSHFFLSLSQHLLN